jgi:hypothetical protein
MLNAKRIMQNALFIRILPVAECLLAGSRKLQVDGCLPATGYCRGATGYAGVQWCITSLQWDIAGV